MVVFVREFLEDFAAFAPQVEIAVIFRDFRGVFRSVRAFFAVFPVGVAQQQRVVDVFHEIIVKSVHFLTKVLFFLDFRGRRRQKSVQRVIFP